MISSQSIANNRELDLELGNHFEETVQTSQNNESAVMICSEINAEVKNLRLEVASLKATIDNIKKTNDDFTPSQKSSRKLPKGLPVSICMHLWPCFNY